MTENVDNFIVGDLTVHRWKDNAGITVYRDGERVGSLTATALREAARDGDE